MRVLRGPFLSSRPEPGTKHEVRYLANRHCRHLLPDRRGDFNGKIAKSDESDNMAVSWSEAMLTLPAGTHVLIVQVDAGGVVNQVSEGNNTKKVKNTVP